MAYATKEKRRAYQREYIKRKRAEDPEWVAKQNERNKLYRRKRRAKDPAYRAKTNEEARIRMSKLYEDPEHREEIKARNREYSKAEENKPGFRRRRKKYYDKHMKDSEFRAKRSEDSKGYAARYPEKAAAHGAVAKAKRDGKLTPSETCEDCGNISQLIEAHHEDYSKQLEVVWLCKLCHVKWDKLRMERELNACLA